MASGRSIKGISVEIDGNVTGLEKALSSVNKTIKETQGQLKDVERLLKLDPTNTELLSQKQQKLKESITATKEKLDALKTAQEQAKKQMESGDLGKDKYDALQREIIATEQELKNLAREAAEANTALNKIDAVGKTLENVGGKMTAVGTSLTRNVTAPIVAAGAAAVKTTADFDAQMSKVSAISGATGDDFDALRAKAREMGAQTKFSATESGQAFEYMAMAGWKTEDMLDGIEGIMSLAAASGEDLATTSDIVTDALTAFGLSASDSGHFADVLAAASSNANTNVSMLGESFKYAAPVAGALGYSAEDTAVALGLMANAGIKASQGGTALRNILTNMAKPTKDSSAAMDRLGISLSDDSGRMYTFKEIMDQMRASFGHINMPVEEFNSQVAELDQQLADGTLTQSKYDKALEELVKQAYGAEGAEKARAAAMLAGKNGMSGLLAIVNASEADYEKLTQAVADSSNEFEYAGQTYQGTAKYMAAIMQQNLTGQITILKSALQELAIQIGDALMPTISNIVAKIQAFVEKLQGMDEGTRNTIIKIAAFAAAIGPALLVLGKLTTGVGKGMQAISSMGKGILTFVNQAKLGVGAGGQFASAIASIGPYGWAVIAVVAALTAAFVHLWKNNEEFREKITAIWEGIKEKFSSAAQKITDAINSLGFDFKDLGEAIYAAWDWICNALEPWITEIFANIGRVIGGIVDVVTGVVQVICGIIKGFKDGDWSLFLDGLKTLWDGLWALLTAPVVAVINVIEGYLEKFGTSWAELWDATKLMFTDIWNGIKDFFVGIWNGIVNAVSTAVNAVRTAITTAFNAVKDFFTNIWNSIVSAVTTAWETIKNIVQVGIMFIKELFSAAFQIITLPFRFIWENCKEIVFAAWDAIKTGVSNAIDAVKTTLETVWNAIWSVLSPIIEMIKTGITTAWETIRDGVTNAVNTLKTTLENVWNAIWSVLSPIIDTIKNGISNAWTAIKDGVTNAVNTLKTTLQTVWNAIWSAISPIIETIRTGITTAWEGIKTGVTTAVNTVKTTVTTVWTAIKTTLTPILEGIKTGITTAWDTAKNAVTNTLNAIKNTVSTVFNGVKNTVNNIVNAVKNTITNGFNAAKNSVTNIFNGIKNGISTALNAAKSAVSNAISNIKSKFNFSWSLPKLKLPHVSITGSFSINPPRVPHFSISWYKKAMDNGMILNKPTIFGQQGSTLLAGGEAGSEAVVGTQSLMEMIRNAVASMAGGTTINYGGVTVNVYAKENQDIRALADEIEYRINNNVLRRRAAYGK